MAIGDVVRVGAYNKANNATTDVQPGSGVEWQLQSVECSAAPMEIYLTDNAGSNWTLIETIAVAGSTEYRKRITNTVYLRLKNVSGSTAWNYAEGVITK